jgi:hypothetical protein
MDLNLHENLVFQCPLAPEMAIAKEEETPNGGGINSLSPKAKTPGRWGSSHQSYGSITIF